MIALLPLAGLCYQYLATLKDEKNYPAPGELVDVGDHKLHIQCLGEERAGVPTVVVETGIWDCSQSWQLVQKELAAFTRVCTYDRAGYGWSEKGKSPRTFEQAVFELKILLQKKGIKPPFILVGHSLGGPIIRIFQNKYPEEVKGIVLVDALYEKPAFTGIWKAVSRAFSFLAYFGILRLLLKCTPNLTPNRTWTAAMQRTYVACHQAKIGTFHTCLDEAKALDASFRSLPELPLSIPVTVIDRKEKIFPGAKVVIAKNCSHLIQLDRPDIIIEEVWKLLKS